MSKSYGNQYKVYDIDERTAKKPIGPRTAAEAIAFAHQHQTPISHYRAEREALDAQRARERVNKAKENLDRRWERAKSAQAEQSPTQKVPKAPQPTRPLSSMAKSNEQRVSSFNQPTTTRNRPAKPKSSALFQSTINPNLRKQSGPPSLCSSIGSEAAAILLSDTQHQKLVREQKARDEQQKAARERERKDAANARQRKAKAEKALEKRRQELINEARASGKGITDAEMNSELEAFMKKREVSDLNFIKGITITN